jgi:hypothetical protein
MRRQFRGVGLGMIGMEMLRIVQPRLRKPSPSLHREAMPTPPMTIRMIQDVLRLKHESQLSQEERRRHAMLCRSRADSSDRIDGYWIYADDAHRTDDVRIFNLIYKNSRQVMFVAHDNKYLKEVQSSENHNGNPVFSATGDQREAACVFLISPVGKRHSGVFTLKYKGKYLCGYRMMDSWQRLLIVACDSNEMYGSIFEFAITQLN